MQRKKLAGLCLFVLLLPILLATTGCSMVVTDAQAAPGTYEADTDWGKSIVMLAADHTFTQTVTLKSGSSKNITGTWTIGKSAGQPVYTTISFSPFMNVTHDKQGVPSAVSMYSIYHVPFGGINIAADPDYGIAHRK